MIILLVDFLLPYIPYFKALHIIGFVAWFAGLFYLVRLFVYHVEANERPATEAAILKKQYQIMEWRLYKIITNPAMMFTFTFGILMLLANPAYLTMPWMHAKLALLIGLLAYHLYCKSIIVKLEKEQNTFSSFQFRLMNELPTIFLVGIVLLAVLKSMLNFFYAFLGLIAFGFILYLGTKFYKRVRERNKTKIN